MMDFFNQAVSTITQLVVMGAGTALAYYGIPLLKKLGVYGMVKIGVFAAEKLAESGKIQKIDKNAEAKKILAMLGIKESPLTDAMIEAACKELDVQEDKLKAELKKG